ncbi:MAG: hypothetical protein GX312_04270 [Candidatus Phytoplasma sp.]|nr:hypothetical protein [Phytoplasma sp.]
MLTLLSQIQLYSIAGASVFLILLIGLIIYLKKQAKSKKKEVIIDDEYVFALYQALGTKENIIQTSLENKRLKVLLKDTRIIQPEDFKKIDTPAFVVGKEIKVLVKYSPEFILKKIDEIRNEGLK